MRTVRALVTLLSAALALGAAHGVALADATMSAGPIQAVFAPAEFATHYTIGVTEAAGRPLTYTWTLTPPDADPGCNHFSRSLTTPPSGTTATRTAATTTSRLRTSAIQAR